MNLFSFWAIDNQNVITFIEKRYSTKLCSTIRETKYSALHYSMLITYNGKNIRIFKFLSIF